jgi:hypothetical protein
VASNSGGGAGYVTGRIVGLAVDPAKHGLDFQPVYAAGAQGGAFRSLDNGVTWTPIADQILTLATGDLRVAPDGSLWYGTGEPNYGDELGSGVYRLAEPWKPTSVFTPADRVGGEELESHWVGKLAFDDTYAYVATSRGVYRRPLSDNARAWTRVLAPVQPQDSVTQNIADDIVVQPGTGYLVANLAYRLPASYNGFYISKDQGDTWTRSKLTGAINPKEVGPSDMAYSADGKRLYVVMESTVDFATKAGALAGVYVSPKGDPSGPWSMIADASKLGNSGSALKPLKKPSGHTYPVGVQAWYNRLIQVDPADHDHVYVGLEEVFETRNGGSSWKAIGRYWNFGFACADTNTCDGNVLHADQHSVAIGNGRVYVGNDGGLYSRKVDGSQQSWTSLSKSGQLRALQYYGIGVGALSADDGGGIATWGGMQDNGVSLLRPADNGEQVSPLGGDGGMMLVDPADGCRAVGEYVGLTLQLTTNCGQSPQGEATIQQIAPADPNPQFIAPFAADDTAAYRDKFWIAAGAYVWENTKTWDSTTEDNGWTKAYDLSADSPEASATTVASQTHEAGGKPVHVEYVGWCGSCSSTTYNSGIATNEGGTWHELPMTYTKSDGTTARMPQRYISAVTIDPADTTGRTIYVVYNGFSARYIEGFGAGVGHVFKSTDGGMTFVDVSGDPTKAADALPDVPASDLVVAPSGSLYLATDLGVFVHPAGSAAGHWERLGTTLPTTISSDLVVFANGGSTWLYDGTFGRGIWRARLD